MHQCAPVEVRLAVFLKLRHVIRVGPPVEFGSLIHGFFGMPGVLPQARRGITTAAQAVREALGG